VVPTVWTYAALSKLDEQQLWNDEMVHMLKVSSSTPTTHHPPLPYSSPPFTLTFPFCLPSQVCFPDSDGLGGSSVLAPSQKKTYMRATLIRNLFNVLCALSYESLIVEGTQNIADLQKVCGEYFEAAYKNFNKTAYCDCQYV
jgi:hypothetical protein